MWLIILLTILSFGLISFSIPMIPYAKAESGNQITTLTQPYAISYSQQRKSFYANGRFWVFYSDGTYMLWAHSSDGITWNPPSTTTKFLNASWGEDAWGGTPEYSELWYDIANAFDDDSDYSTLYAGYAGEDYWLKLYDYDEISSSVNVGKVRIRIDSRTYNNPGEIALKVSWDGGVSWSSEYDFTVNSAWGTDYVDVTSATDWNPTKINDVWVKIWDRASISDYYLDWLSVEVTYYSSQSIRRVNYGYEFSVWNSGDSVYYAYAQDVLNNPLLFRRGTLNSDGTITWSASEQTVFSASSSRKYMYPYISVDTSDFPWISYGNYTSGSPSLVYPYVVKSSADDGTWVTDSGFPHQLSSTSATWYSAIVPLTVEKMYVVYGYTASILKGVLWSGSSFGSEENVSVYPTALFYFSVISKEDNVHVTYVNNTVYKPMFYRKRSCDSGWGTQELLVQNGYLNYAPTLTLFGNDLYCFWASAPIPDDLYYKKRVSGLWDSSATVWITDEPTIEPAYLISSFFEAEGNSTHIHVGLVYVSGSSPTYYLKFVFKTHERTGVSEGVDYAWELGEAVVAVLIFGLLPLIVFVAVIRRKR